LTVPSNAAPTGTITAPTSSTTYRGGQVITFAGSGSDPEDGALTASALTWRVDFHHDDHSHPHVADTSGITSGSFTAATSGETSANVFYRVTLTVRDSAGLTQTSSVDVRPLTSVVRIESNVAGAQLTLDGSPITAPFQFVGVEGIVRTLGVVTPQTSGGTTYEFANWSDGGAASHEISTPTADTTYTAMFQAGATGVIFSDDFEQARGWALTAGRNPATTGRWERGDPQSTSGNGITVQLGTCQGPSVNCLITGLSAGSAAGANDVDGGMTSIQSPAIALPAGGRYTLSFRIYLAHLNNATTADFVSVRVVGNNGQAQTVWSRGAVARNMAGAWVTRTADISAYAGQTIYLRIEAVDNNPGSVIEAGVDNVVITRQ
jgi:hypothetical protein